MKIVINRSLSGAGKCRPSYLNTIVCSNLQQVLLNVSQQEAVTSDCVDILITEGDYFIIEFVKISRNIRLYGQGKVTVHFNFSAKFNPRRTTQPLYVLSFYNADSLLLRGIDFIGTPGIITIFNLSSTYI